MGNKNTAQETKSQKIKDYRTIASIKNIDKIIKAIAFIISNVTLIASAAASIVLIIFDKSLIIVAIAILILGIICAFISLFLLYGLGHIISQNNEILEKL